MKKYILPFMSIAMLMAMASCSSSDDEVAENSAEGKLVQMTFTATQESNVGTRTALDNKNVIWKEGDKISVFDGVNDTKYNHEFTLSRGDRSPLGSFTGEVYQTNTMGSYYAVYPYTVGATCGGSDLINGITLPSEQTAYENSFDPKAALMMARSSDKNTFIFLNVVSLVKVTTTFPCKRIVLNANENIAGKGNLYCSDTNPYINFTSNRSKSIILKPATDGGEIEAGTYYIAVKPGKLSSGWSISFTSTDYNVYTRKADSDVIFNSGSIRSIGRFYTSGTWTHTSRGDIVTAEKEVDLGLTITKEDGKKYRVIFANANLTTTGLAASETAYGDYFAWGATSVWYSAINKENDTWSITPIDGKPGGYISNNYPTANDFVVNKVLKMEYDAARQILGGGWQIPTKDIWDKLLSQVTSRVFDSENKVYKFTSNKQTLFLPAAGYVHDVSFESVGSFGAYWSGTFNNSRKAYYLSFDIGGVNVRDQGSCWDGLLVRPVRLVAVD